MRDRLRLGGGAGFAGDRLDAPLHLAEHGALDYLVLECLAERTIALAQLRRRRNPSVGYDSRLAERIDEAGLDRTRVDCGLGNPGGHGDVLARGWQVQASPLAMAVR